MAKTPSREPADELLLFAEPERPAAPAESVDNPSEASSRGVPLAARMRPSRLEDFQGHTALFSGHGILSGAETSASHGQSLILWGPPGSGKTTLAHILAKLSGARVHHLSAVTAGLADLREVVARCQPGQANVLFLDEIHRFNKTQQDALLPIVESGRLRLLGATTENPYFELRKALLSRCRVVRLEKLSPSDLEEVLRRALAHPDGYGSMPVTVSQEVIDTIAATADGDARTALNLLELVVARGSYGSQGEIRVEFEHLETALNDQHLAYNRDSDRKYDLTSAFIKSIRGSDPDAALYWLACMLTAGEDPRYIMRRLLISASEDIGLADPSALAVVTACAQSLEWVGLPEGKYPLSQATLYLATAAKSNSTAAIFSAEAQIRRHGAEEVPNHLRDGSYKGADRHGIGQGYISPHSVGEHFINQQYLPDSVQRGSFYRPGQLGYEKVIRQRLEHWYDDKGER